MLLSWLTVCDLAFSVLLFAAIYFLVWHVFRKNKYNEPKKKRGISILILIVCLLFVGNVLSPEIILGFTDPKNAAILRMGSDPAPIVIHDEQMGVAVIENYNGGSVSINAVGLYSDAFSKWHTSSQSVFKPIDRYYFENADADKVIFLFWNSSLNRGMTVIVEPMNYGFPPSESIEVKDRYGNEYFTELHDGCRITYGFVNDRSDTYYLTINGVLYQKKIKF